MSLPFSSYHSITLLCLSLSLPSFPSLVMSLPFFPIFPSLVMSLPFSSYLSISCYVSPFLSYLSISCYVSPFLFLSFHHLLCLSLSFLIFPSLVMSLPFLFLAFHHLLCLSLSFPIFPSLVMSLPFSSYLSITCYVSPFLFLSFHL